STILVCGAYLLTSFSKNDVNASTDKATIPVMGAMAEKGITTSIPAYYDHKLFTILFFEFPSKAEETLLNHNPGINFIYQSDQGLPGGPFISVLDAVPGDGMNPVWEEVQITFNSGFTPRQLYSDDEIFAAAESGEITLTHTGEVYVCPVIGKKPK
ncbi:MAG: hypothetical protein ACM3RX_06095, partial [Methanococcaceae archaeon]